VATRVRRGARTEPGAAAWRVIGGWGAAALLVATLASGCGDQPVPSATPTGATTPTATAAPPPTPAPTPTPVAFADTLRVGWVPGELETGFGMYQGFRQLSGAEYPNRIRLQNTVMAALYRLDARYGAVPDLADGPCVPPGDDPTVLRCRLVETTWHDGTPVTADDVAFVHGLWMRLGWFANLKEVRVVDPRTVDFVLTKVDGSFPAGLSSLAFTMQPRHAFEAAYADFRARTNSLEAADLTRLADTVDEELARDPPVCTTRLDEVGALIDTIGLRLYREDFSLGQAGTFDSCAYMAIASGWIRAAGDALAANTLDAAVGRGLLSIDTRPIGAGPYRFVSEDAKGIHLEAWPGYHRGRAATRFVDFVSMGTHGPGVVDGTIDVDQGAQGAPGAALTTTVNSGGVRLTVQPEGGGYISLSFNVRPGQLFAERDLRLALQQCFDLERSVDAATGGTGIPIWSPVLAGSWAWEPDLPKPARDVAAARKLIEGAGWTPGEDGIYTKDGVRLAADILVRANAEPRIKTADLIARQAGDCGMDIRTRPLEFEDMGAMLSQYPHNVPGTDRPFDIHIGGWSGGTSVDPAGALSGHTSSQVSDAEHPDSANFLGFTDPAFDRLVEAAAVTYDQDERARLYREAQRELATQEPVIYLWSGGVYDAVRSDVATVDGALDLTVPNWAWQPERLVVAKSGS
jgi:ABC-type transport system substrate-binding protein